MNKKIILINLPPSPKHEYINSGALFPATGILLIGTIFKNHGFKVQVIDGAIKSDYEKRTLESVDKDTVMVGFSLMTSQVAMALNLSAMIKDNFPGIIIVWGGIHPILFPEQTISNHNIDIVVTGEGFETSLDLIDYLNGNKDIEQIRGIAFKNSSGAPFFTEKSPYDDINKFPHFDFEILKDTEVYLGAKNAYQREICSNDNKNLRVMPILTGLGCCYKCQFCINVILKRKYRFRTAVSIIDEIKRNSINYSANAFVFYDEDFLISKKRLLEFLDLIEKENLNFYWRIWARVDYFREDYLNRDLISRLERCGLRSIAMGAESGSQKVIDLILKGIKVENILVSANMLKSTLITPRYSFIVGLEGEDKEDTKLTYKLCADLLKANPSVDIAGPYVFRYYPGSPIFDKIVNKYKVWIPEKIEDWQTALHKEGFLKIESMPWVWDGCIESAETLNQYIHMHNRLRMSNNILSRMINMVIIWRLRNFNTRIPVEMYLYSTAKNIYHRYLALKNRYYGKTLFKRTT